MDNVKKQLISNDINRYREAVENSTENKKHISDAINTFCSSDMMIRDAMTRFTTDMQLLKYNYIFPKKNLVCTCFRVTLVDSDGEIIDTTSSVYGYIYSEVKRVKTGSYDFDNLYYDDFDPDVSGGDIGNEIYDHKFICFGGTYHSQDGEYRRRIVPYNRIKNIIAKYPDVCNAYEECIVDLMNKERLVFNAEIYYPSDENSDSETSENITINKSKFEESINSSRASIFIFMMCVMIDHYNVKMRIIENHINPAYLYIIANECFDDAFEKAIQIQTNEKYHEVISYAELYNAPASYKPGDAIPRNQTRLLRVGQKLFPLTMQEANEKMNILSPIWAEIYVNLIVTDIFANLVSNSFAVMQDVVIINNTCSNMYDNPTAEVKYIQGDYADECVEALKTADDITYSSVDKQRSKKFAHLSSLINKSIDYAQYDISVSPNALCVISNYIGRTIRDIPAFILSKAPDVDNWRTFHTHAEAFAGYMFEYTYSLYCLNTIAHIMQGDLHTNNATLYRFSQFNTPDKLYKMYVLDTDHAFVFENIGVTAGIIDFSRSIFGNYQQIADDFGENLAKLFFEKQNTKIHTLIKEAFPSNYQKHNKVLNDIATENMESFFNVICIADMFVLTHGIISIIKRETNLKFNPLIISHVHELNEKCKSLFTTHLDALAADPKSHQPNLNHVLLTTLWEKYRLTPKTENSVVTHINSVYIYKPMSKFKYSLHKYSQWPPILNMEVRLQAYNQNNVPDPGYQEVIDLVHSAPSDEEVFRKNMNEVKANSANISDPNNPRSWMWS